MFACRRDAANRVRDSREVIHLQDDDMRVSKAVKEGFKNVFVVIGNAVVRKLVPGVAGLCDWLEKLPMMKV